MLLVSREECQIFKSFRTGITLMVCQQTNEIRHLRMLLSNMDRCITDRQLGVFTVWPELIRNGMTCCYRCTDSLSGGAVAACLSAVFHPLITLSCRINPSCLLCLEFQRFRHVCLDLLRVSETSPWLSSHVSVLSCSSMYISA